MDLQARLAELNLELPAAPKPVAAYVPGVRSGRHIFVSGQLPTRDGNLLASGPIGSAVSVDDGYKAAAQCALNALAIVDDLLGGDWSKFVRIVRVGGFVASEAGFAEQSKVINGASELLGEIFGSAGVHARAAVGVIALPLGASVEVEMMVEVAD